MMTQITREMRDCVGDCQECQQTCLETVGHCLELGNEHAGPDHIRLLLSCAEICATAARFMLLDSRHHTLTCRVCADVCEACADECDKFDDDEMMTECAEVCRQCADSCREMSMTRTRSWREGWRGATGDYVSPGAF